MSQVLKFKRSSTPGAVPATLEPGEIAINDHDGKIFLTRASDVVELGDLVDRFPGELVVTSNPALMAPRYIPADGTTYPTGVYPLLDPIFGSGSGSWQTPIVTAPDAKSRVVIFTGSTATELLPPFRNGGWVVGQIGTQEVIMAPKEFHRFMNWSSGNTYCSGLVANGFDDWILPTVDMCYLMHRALKPQSATNRTTVSTYWPGAPGQVDSAVPPSAAWTAADPGLTPYPSFRYGGSNCPFDTASLPTLQMWTQHATPSVPTSRIVFMELNADASNGYAWSAGPTTSYVIVPFRLHTLS